MARVIHTGQAMVDEVVTIDTLPARGSNQMASSYQRYAGGSINILVAAVRNGAPAVLAGSHGTGPHGDLIRSVAAAEHIEVSSPITAELDTGVCFVMVEPSAERTFVTTLGAERRISVESLATALAEAGDLVHISGYTLAVPQTREPLMSWWESLPGDVVTVLDPGPMFAALPDDLRTKALGLTRVWTSNAEEAEQLTGASTMTEACAAVSQLLPPGAVSIVRDGSQGCAVRVAGATSLVPGFPQDPVDTNGAGDCHTGVLSAERALGLDWVQACERANAAAAIKVTRRGPASSPTRDEVDAFLAGNPPRSVEP